MNSARSATDEVAAALYAPTYRIDDEAQLQTAIDAVLRAREWGVRREVGRVGGKGRIDFVVLRREWLVGVEVKISGAPGAVLRQISGYLESGFWVNGLERRLSGLVLATTRFSHHKTLGGLSTLSERPVAVAFLSRGGVRT